MKTFLMIIGKLGVFLLVISVLGFIYVWIAQSQVAIELKQLGGSDSLSESRASLEGFQSAYRWMMWAFIGAFVVGFVLRVTSFLKRRNLQAA